MFSCFRDPSGRQHHFFHTSKVSFHLEFQIKLNFEVKYHTNHTTHTSDTHTTHTPTTHTPHTDTTFRSHFWFSFEKKPKSYFAFDFRICILFSMCFLSFFHFFLKGLAQKASRKHWNIKLLWLKDTNYFWSTAQSTSSFIARVSSRNRSTARSQRAASTREWVGASDTTVHQQLRTMSGNVDLLTVVLRRKQDTIHL